MKKIINCETGEIVEVEVSAKELIQAEIDMNAFAIREAETAAKAEARAALLERLGITEEEAQLLLGGN